MRHEGKGVFATFSLLPFSFSLRLYAHLDHALITPVSGFVKLGKTSITCSNGVRCVYPGAGVDRAGFDQTDDPREVPRHALREQSSVPSTR